MSSIQNIMLATDFSNGAEAAARLAIEMARKFTAKLTILHVSAPPIYTGVFGDAYALPPEVLEKVRAATELELEKLCLRATKEGIRVDTLIVEGIAADAIIAAAHSHGVGLIAMGTHGRTGLKHFLLGSVAERVVRTAKCPVLTVHAGAPGETPGA